jgi:Spore Coat Protein U domain
LESKLKAANSTKLNVLASAIVAAGLGMSATAFASGTTPLTVNAQILGTCKVTTVPGTLNFGTIDPSTNVNATASTTFAMKCTNGTVATAPTDDNGLHFSVTKRMLHPTIANTFLSYAVAYVVPGFTGTGFGAGSTADTVTINGTITPAQFQNAVATAGTNYTDTVTITVNP